MARRYTYKKPVQERGLIWKSRYGYDAFRTANIIADELFDTQNRRLKTLLTERQTYALARAQGDPITQRVEMILTNCSISSLKKNKEKIIAYYTNCFDWIDPVVASILFEQAIDCRYRDKNRGDIHFDRHYANKRYSDGNNGIPFASIHFDKDATLDEVIDYLRNHWEIIHDENLATPKQTQSNLEKIRETIIRALYYNHRNSTADDTIEAIECVAKQEPFLQMADNLSEKEVYTIRQRLRRDLEKDWFVHVFADYESDKQANKQLYDTWKKAYFENKYQEYFGKKDVKVERLVRFDLGFDRSTNRFTLTKI